KVSTSASFPGFASRRTYSATVTIFVFLLQFRLDSLGSCEAVPAAAVGVRCAYSETVLQSPETIAVMSTILSFGIAEQAAFYPCPMLDASLPCLPECTSSRSPIADYRQAKSCS